MPDPWVSGRSRSRRTLRRLRLYFLPPVMAGTLPTVEAVSSME